MSLGSLAVALLIAAPWQGWLYVALVAPVALTFGLVDVLIRRTRYPERVSAGAILITLLVLAVGVALNGGSTSSALPWLVLPVATSAARFRPRVVVVGVLLTVAAILGATFGSDTTAALNEPAPVIATLGLLVSLMSIVWAIEAAELHHREASVLDPLTALLNRSSLLPRFTEIVQQARVTKRPVCLLMCDIDTFKEINDTYGHDRGDAVLQEVAYQLRKQLRSFELIYRLGGEEFLVVLPGVGLARGTEIAQRLCTAVAQTKSAGVHITISIGVSAARGEEAAFEPLFKTADSALYEAKRAGGNGVVATHAEPVIARSEPATA
ncbi:MAG: GGDEF domain-containing protein [Acidobacteriota bacterium]|nr:GGDEF domain-containing protein [Acidobacteriota bacterium]